MEVKLLTTGTQILYMEYNAAYAALTCHDNTERIKLPEYRSSDMLKHIIKLGHESVLEHINLTYEVKGLSRACLQELARHRHISLSVESTRHTIKEKTVRLDLYPADAMPDVKIIDYNLNNVPASAPIIDLLFDIVEENPDITDDELKYFIPEFLPTNLVMTCNVRELRHILELRTAPQALKEFQELAHALFNAVPLEFQYLLEDKMYKEKEEK